MTYFPKDVGGGVAGLSLLKDSNAHRLRGIFGGFGDNYSVVSGSWGIVTESNQRDFDPILLNSAGYKFNSTRTNLDEIKWPNVILTFGTYKILLVVSTRNNGGIMELLHGTTSIGTYDTYAVNPGYNVLITFTYTNSLNSTGMDFRLRVNSKNASSVDYIARFSRLEIIKTG